MGYFWTERFKEQFGKEKEALELYEKETGKDVKSLYKNTFLGDNSEKGTLFEFYVFKHLYKISGYHKFLFNVYLPTNNSKINTSEIDIIFLHEKGIFVFECKSYSGKIYGKENAYKWTQYLEGHKIQFYNPVMQNKKHIKILENFLSDKEKELVLSLIVFSGRAEIKVDFEPYRLYIGDTDECILELKKLLRKLPNRFTVEEIDALYSKLFIYSKPSEEEKANHIHEINKIMDK